MIQHYIFDLGNVLAWFDPYQLTAAHVQDETARVLISEVVFDRLYWDQLDDGSITDDEVKLAFCNRLPQALHEDACRVYDNWVVSMPPVTGMKELITELKACGHRIYLLSNISVGFANTYTDSPYFRDLLSLFDGLVFSGLIGMVKPNREIFEHLLERFALTADECLFIDDNAANIAAAKAIGIHGYLFDGDAVKLQTALNTIGRPCDAL